MNRLFWRFAALVMLAITLATCVIYFTFSRLFGDPLEEIARRQAAGQIFLLEQYIDKAPADEWLPRLNKVREVSEATLELQPLQTVLAALPASKRSLLLQGAVVIDIGGKAFYRRVDTTGARYIGSNDDVIHAQRLPIDIGQALGMEAIRFGVIALFLLVPIGWWSRRHWRGLMALSRMADDFGQGNLAARAVVRPASSIAPLAGRINDMAGRIDQLMEARKNLLHSVSHELRTPIARLEFGLELLRERHAADDPALQKRIAAMETDVDELKTLVNELLDLTQLDHAQAMPRKPFALAPLLHACAPPQPRQNFSASIAADLGELQGDTRLLARAINNLLGNAAKYAASRIALSATRSGNAVRITVEDDGPGIPAEARERVFEPFYRLAREQDYATTGYGLGLAIAAKAIVLHGGAIAIDDSPLGGARFTITL
ncbi:MULTISPECIES: ATP-binding protein [unclassified Duganella]|uniref:ATP-binding protein n=1 Tax=unclassified Duganella TaxID=2636909 RepID=UPI000874E704|nr:MULTISPECIES: ATP-binding protein [unclassified Duganella]OEZ62811.1 sensor protein RstB [Duganella sp. HH105]OFA02063.1 sensor protein RstB [Duganella sp. HH101]